MGANAQLAKSLRELAMLMEIGGERSFRIAALEGVARRVESLTEDIREIAPRPGVLESIEGIGASSVARIRGWCTTGELEGLNEWRRRVPPSLLDLVALPGVGPATARRLWKEADVTDLLNLRAALLDGRLSDLKGFGPRTLAQLDQALRDAEAQRGRYRLGRATRLADDLIERIRNLPEVREAAVAGSIRRGCETVRNINLVVVADDPAAAAANLLEQMPGTIREEAPGAYSGLHASAQSDMPPLDLLITPAELFGHALLERTGPPEFVRLVRDRLPGNVHGADEAALLLAAGLDVIPPELRDRPSDSLAAVPADLITIADIIADLHTHTTASDGHLNPEAAIAEARRRKLRVLAITDHSVSSGQANGLSIDRLRTHVAHIRELAAQTKDLLVLAGAEVDILPDGSLDYDDETLRLLDVVVASPHAALTQDEETATERMLRAIRHPLVRIIGHPTGRILQRRRGLPLDMPRIVAAAVEHDVALEINANPLRLDLCAKEAARVMDAGGLIAINTDMHGPAQFDHLTFGVKTARRGGVTKARCINTWPPDQLLRWLRR